VIYVVESMASNTPVRLARGPSLAAYPTREAAKRAARSLGGIVREYAVAQAATGDTAEHLARVVDDLQAECVGLRMEIADQRDGHAAHRARYGAREGETMGQWLGRLHRGYQALQTIRQALVGPGILRDDDQEWQQ